MLCDKFNFEFNSKKLMAIKDFLEDNVNKKYYYDDRYKIWKVLKRMFVKM
jgi:hypothetical protein